MPIKVRAPIDMAQLEVQNVQLQQLSVDPTTPVEGQIYYRNDSHKVRVNDGSDPRNLRYEDDNTFTAPVVINTDGVGTDTALSIGATGINSPRLLVDVATQTPKLTAYSTAASTSMEPTLIQAVDSNSKVDVTANSVKVYRTDIVQNMELTDSDLLKNGVSISSLFAPTSHASSATTYGAGSPTNYGHVKLYSSTGTSTDGTMDRNSITSALAEKATDADVLHKTGAETATGAKNFTATSYAGVINMQRTNAATTGTYWCARLDEQTSSTPADGLGPALAFSLSLSGAPDTKYDLGAIQMTRLGGNNTTGRFSVEARRAGTGYVPFGVDYNSVQVVSSNSGMGSNLVFLSDYDESNSLKQGIQWYNFDRSAKMLIGRRDGNMTNVAEDLRIAQIGTPALGHGCVRIGEQTDATNVSSNAQVAIGTYGPNYCGIWHGSVALGSRSLTNHSMIFGANSTYVNAPGSGFVGLGVADEYYVQVAAAATTISHNVKMTASYATLEFTPPSDSGNDSKQAVRFTTSAGALKSFVGYGSGAAGEYLRCVTVGTLNATTPKVLIGTIASGISGGGAGSMSIGCWGGAYTGIWAGGLTESATNEGIRLGPDATVINAPTNVGNVHIRNGETKNVVFNADPIANTATQGDAASAIMGGNTANGWSIWGGGITAGASNYAFYAKGDGTAAELNGTTECTMRVNSATKIKALSTGAEVTGILDVSSYISAGWVGSNAVEKTAAYTITTIDGIGNLTIPASVASSIKITLPSATAKGREIVITNLSSSVTHKVTIPGTQQVRTNGSTLQNVDVILSPNTSHTYKAIGSNLWTRYVSA